MAVGRSVTLSAVLGVAAWLAPSEAEAAKFVADLSSYKVTAQPGEVLTRPYRLTLDGSELPTRFTLRAEDWWRSEDGEQSFYAAPGTIGRSCATWVSVNPVDIVAQPAVPMTARLTITVPADVTPGGYWCVLTIDEVPDPLIPPTGVGAQFMTSVSTGMFLYIEPVTRSVKFTDVRVTADHTVITLENDGNAPVAVEGRVEFVRPGERAPTASVTLTRTTLLPEPVTRGVLRASLPPPPALPAGTYLVRVIVDIGLDHYLGVERELVIPRVAVINPQP